MKRPNMRPVMEEYTSTTSPPTNSQDFSKSNTASSHHEKSQNKMESHYDKNNLNSNKESLKAKSEHIEEDPTTPQTSQAHKTKEKDYKINPRVIPRPNHFDEIYKNQNKEPFYDTNEDIHPPHSSTYYVVNETQNSSCRFIRSSLTKIPTDNSILSASNLMFGLYCQPFAELGEDEKPIPVVQSDEGIFRCKRCQAYINSKYEMGYSNNNKQTATCNICSCPNELDSGKNIVKNEYFGSNFSLVPELSCPTIDFTAPTTMKHANPFRPQYLFMIDISQVSYDLGFYNYILNSIITNLEYFHNAAGSYVAFATYDHRSLQFFTIEKSNDVKAYIVADIMNPFCPLPANKLFFNVVEQKSEIEKIVEKINYFVNEKYQNPSKKPSPGSISGAAIKTGIEALEENGGRVMLFSCNSCLEGYAATKPREESKILNTKDEKTLFLPQHEEFNKLSEVCLSKRIVVDQFIFASNAYDLATYSGISNSTGGCVNFYPCTSKDVVDIKYKFEKLHYDLSRVLTRPNYYDVKFMLRFSLGIDTIEILGPFNKKLGVAFQVSGCDPDYSFGYNLRLSESLKNGGRYHFQLVCLYIDNFNQRYLRTFNYTVLATNEISKIYTSADVDSLAKLMVLKEASLCHHMEINLIRENLNTKIINSFLYYRNQCSKHTPVAQLILPASIKYLPLYLNSLIKKSLLKKIKKDVSFNSIIGLMNKLMREPIYHTCKFLYPKFFRIDDIQYDQSSKFKDQDSEYIIHDIGLVNEKYTNLITKPYMLPLSLDHIDFYCAYLSDDGEYINLYIFNYINPQFYQELFGVESWEEAVKLDLEALEEGNTNDLNIRLLNIISQLRKDNKGFTQPVRLYFLDDRGYTRPELANILIEDRTKDEPHYVDFLCGMHEEIQRKMNN